MSNVFTTIGHDVKVGAEDVAHGVEVAVKYAIVNPVEFTAKAIAVIEKAGKDAPAVKSAFEGLVSQIAAVDTAVSAEVSAKGIDIPEYIVIFNAVKSLLSYFKATVVPTVENTYGDLKTAANS